MSISKFLQGASYLGVFRSHFLNGHDRVVKRLLGLNGTMFERQKRGGLVGGKILSEWTSTGKIMLAFDLSNVDLSKKKDVTVSSKIGDTSLVRSFRRIPRGGIEQIYLTVGRNLFVLSYRAFGLTDELELESRVYLRLASASRRIDESKKCLPNIGEETRWVMCVQ
ncbi:hypothetical protein Tco_0983210 [Tanacetum coccineum]